MARPTHYTPEVAATICRELAAGRSLVSICRDNGMPARSTVYEWLEADADGFSDRYARARVRQADALLDEILEIADDASRDVVRVGEGDSSYERERFTASARDKLKIDTRKWAMAKLAPKKYGDRLALTDGDGKPLPMPEIRIYTGAPPLSSSEKEVDDV